MEESTECIYGRLPRLPAACDTCYVKKTRCDRREPCRPCAAAGISCVRIRQRQTRPKRRKTDAPSSTKDDVTPKKDALEGIMERLAQMEGALNAVRQHAIGVGVQPTTSIQTSSDRSLSQEIASPGWQIQDLSSQSTSARGDAVAVHQVGVVSQYLNCEIPASFRLTSASQRVLFEADMLLAGLHSVMKEKEDPSTLTAVPDHASLTDVPNFYVPELYPDVDVFYVLFSECLAPTAIDFLEGFGGMTTAQVEEMLFALVNCTVHGPQRLQYLICINYMGWLILHVLDCSLASRLLQKYQRKKRQTYFENIMFCLQHLEFEIGSDMTLLQTACAAAHILHCMGCPQESRRLTRIACQIGLRLRNDEDNLARMPSDMLKQFYFSLIRCNLQDKTIALHFVEAPATATSDMNIASLDGASASSEVGGMALVMVNLITAEDAIIRNQLDAVGSATPSADFQNAMRSARFTMDQFMSQLTANTDAYWSYEWLCVDFIYYTLLARGISIGLYQEGGLGIYEECLSNVREALDALISMLEHTSETRSSRMKCLGSLTWILSYFLLWPMYFLFRHIVVTPEHLDVKRFKSLTELLRENVERHSLKSVPAKAAEDLMVLFRDHVDIVVL